MPAKVKKRSGRPDSPASQLATWARLGVESFLDTQNVLQGLTARQKAQVVSAVQERLDHAMFRPAGSVAKFADRGIESSTAAAKYLLDLAAAETATVVRGLKEALHAPAADGAASQRIRRRIETLIDMPKRLLDAAAEQAHAVVESYRKGGLMAGAGAAELLEREIERFVNTEKKFLDLTAQALTVAAKGLNGRGKPALRRNALKQSAQQGVEHYIEVQKKLLELAIEQQKIKGSQGMVSACKEAPKSWADPLEKSFQNLIGAGKALVDLVIKPIRGRPEKKRIPVPALSLKKAFDAKKNSGSRHATPVLA